MTWSRKALVAALLLIAPVLSSCSERQDPILPPVNVVSGPQEGLLGGLVGGVLNLVGGVLNILTGPDANGSVAQAWIDSDGGTLSTAAYELKVPRNAVSQPTLFELRPANDGSYKVELNAYRKEAGVMVEVGSQGFKKPVAYVVSYAKANGVTDPRKLMIVFLRPDGKAEIQPSVVDTYNKTVISALPHFSKYALAQN